MAYSARNPLKCHCRIARRLIFDVPQMKKGEFVLLTVASTKSSKLAIWDFLSTDSTTKPDFVTTSTWSGYPQSKIGRRYDTIKIVNCVVTSPDFWISICGNRWRLHKIPFRHDALCAVLSRWIFSQVSQNLVELVYFDDCDSTRCAAVPVRLDQVCCGVIDAGLDWLRLVARAIGGIHREGQI